MSCVNAIAVMSMQPSHSEASYVGPTPGRTHEEKLHIALADSHCHRRLIMQDLNLSHMPFLSFSSFYLSFCASAHDKALC